MTRARVLDSARRHYTTKRLAKEPKADASAFSRQLEALQMLGLPHWKCICHFLSIDFDIATLQQSFVDSIDIGGR